MQKKLLQLLLLCCTMSVMAQPVPQEVKSDISTKYEAFHWQTNAMEVLNGQLLFAMDDGVHGYELWRTDGTDMGTELVKDLCPDDCSGLIGYFDRQMTTFKGKVYFAGYDPMISHNALYRTDGTTAGTEVFATLGGAVSHLTVADDYLFFESHTGIYRTDGIGTELVMARYDTIDGVKFQGQLLVRRTAAAGGKLFYLEGNQLGYQLFATDGTAAGTHALTNIKNGSLAVKEISSFFEFNNKMYFVVTFETKVYEIWVSDGTEAGTMSIAQMEPSTFTGAPGGFTHHKGKFYFSSNEDPDFLYESDGTSAGTKPVQFGDIKPLDGSIMSFGDNLILSCGIDLKLHRLLPGGFPIQISNTISRSKLMIRVGDLIYFNGNAGGKERLFATDGTGAGTQRLWDEMATEQFENPINITRFGDKIAFIALIPFKGTRLMTVDVETVSGTFEEKPISCQIFPNPSTNSIQITLPADFQTQDAQVQVYGVDGKLLQQLQFTGTDVDISTLPKGQYILKVLGGKGAVAVSSFVKI